VGYNDVDFMAYGVYNCSCRPILIYYDTDDTRGDITVYIATLGKNGQVRKTGNDRGNITGLPAN
jgi:hypothetical protein